MTASVPGLFSLQLFTDTGAPASGYRLYTYEHGTTTFKAAYTDVDGTIAHTYASDGVGGQYIALNARGELPAPLYLDNTAVYDIVLKRDDGSTAWSRRADPIGALSASLAAQGGSALIGFIQSGAGAVLRTQQDKDRESISVADFGAVGDGTADDTLAFSRLEAAFPGVQIDLLGASYVVSSVPTGCRYYNGRFIAGSSRVSLRSTAIDHPMDGNSWIAYGDSIMHYWFTSAVYISTTGRMLAIGKAAWRHDTSESSPINVIFSDDRGSTWYGEKTIYAVAGIDICDAKAGLMGSGRIGVLCSLRSGSLSGYRNDFVYSDDSGVTWTSISSVIPDGSGAFVYGDMMRYPASVGGHDTDGWIVYAYLGVNIYQIYTVNNGLTWTISLACTGPVGQAFAEASVVQVNSESKWIMFIRRNSDTLYVSTSTDMTTWAAPSDTGIPLKSNPVYAIVHGGRLFVYFFMRDFGKSTLGVENEILLYEEDPAAVYSAKNLVNRAPRVVADGVDRALGYVKIMPVGNDFAWIYTAGEYIGSTLNEASTCLVCGSTRRASTVGKTFVESQAYGQNIIRNGTFELWSRGTSFAGITTNTKTADGWAFWPSGATATVSRRDFTPEESALFPFHPQYGLTISATADDASSLVQEWFGTQEMYRIADAPIAIQAWGIGDVPSPGMRVGIQFYYGEGGSSLVQTAALMTFAESLGNLWKATAILRAPTLKGKTIGTSPAVRFILGNSANVEAWSATIAGVKFEIAASPSKFAPTDVSVDRLRCARYVQTAVYDSADSVAPAVAASSTTAYAVVDYLPMEASPSVSILSGSAGSLEVYPLGSTVTGLAPTSVGNRSAGLSITTTGMTAGNSYFLRTKSGSAITLLIDAE